MISKSLRSIAARANASRQMQAGLVSIPSRSMGGGEKKPNMPAAETEFDIVFVGGGNATAITKFIQSDDVNYKMALISSNSKFVQPHAYFGVCHEHITPLKLESGTVSSQVDPWSRTNVGAKVTKFLPNENKIQLSTGQEYSYKALVLSPGFDHRPDLIEGLPELRKSHESERVYVHMLDSKETVEQNYYHGWGHTAGDMINYSPLAPYKGEGSDFYSLYYESFMRQDKLQGRAGASAKIQYWTPNKEIFKFGYANEVALDECWKRGIDVMFGWEMIKVHKTEIGEKFATFKNVDTGEILEKPFFSATINPPSVPHKELVDAGITGSNGLIDVNPYTLQHSRFDNIFAFGDAIDVNTTRTQHAAFAQCPVVKHNVKAFMEGQELNGIYDGFSYMPFYLSHSNATCFSHLHDYEPAANNHWCPSYGLFSQRYFKWQMGANQKLGDKYTSFKKNSGPPHWNWNPSYDPLECNEYLASKGVDVEKLKSLHTKDAGVSTV